MASSAAAAVRNRPRIGGPCDSPGRGNCLRADRHGGAWAVGAGVAGTSAGDQRWSDPAGNRPRRPGPAGASAREAPAARRHDGPAGRAPAHRGADGLQRRGEHRAGSRRFPNASAGAARDRGRQQQQGPHGGGRPRARRHRRARIAAGIRPVRLPGAAGGAGLHRYGAHVALRRGHDVSSLRHRQVHGATSRTPTS